MQLNPDNTATLTLNGHPLKLTHLDKIYWPDCGYTKKDLIEYYHQCAKFILPYLKNHPMVLHRYPNGINQKSFYQKNMTQTPSWLTTQAIYSASDKNDVNYMILENEAGLIYLANLGCIDMNPWLSKCNALETPEYCVLDLDPYEIEFTAVIEVARHTHRFLEQLGVTHCCKTSGATGLHIYIPLQHGYTYEQSRQFAELIFTYIHQEIPKFTSLERMPERRKGAVYLDYLQNRIGQTMASAYSVRPYPGATVSTPLYWEEVNKRLNPGRFTIKSIGKRLEQEGEIWGPMLKKKVNIQKVLEALS